MLFQSLASVIDQFLLSGLNFGIGLLLIRLTSKEDYGLYTQLFAAALLASTLLDAFLGSTLTTLASRKPASERLEMIGAALKLQWILSALMAFVFATVCYAVLFELEENSSPIPQIAVAFGIYVFSLTQREFRRTLHFLDGKALKVLNLDGWFVLFATFGGLTLWHFQSLTLSSIFSMLALANFLSDVHIFNLKTTRFSNKGHIATLLKEIWPMSRWAVPGALLGWAGNYSYLYLATLFLSLSAAADLNASRLLLMPIALIGVAWSRVARPAAGALIVQQNWQKLHKLSLQSVVGMEAITCSYVIVLLLSFDWLSTHILGAKYANIIVLIEIWGVYFAINVARNIATSWMSCFGAYSDMFWMGIGGLLLQWAFCIIMLPKYGAIGAVTSLLAVEVIELIIFWAYLLPKARRSELAKSGNLAS